MAITEAFKRAVTDGDILGLRIMMKDSLLVDPTFRKFDDMSQLTANVNGLYDAHDGGEFIMDKAAWNDDYMNKLMVEVVGNFSHERLNHLKTVVQRLRPVPQAETRRTSQDTQGKAGSSSAKIVAGAVAGGIVGGALAGAVGSAVFVGVAAGAVAVGAAVAISTARG